MFESNSLIDWCLIESSLKVFEEAESGEIRLLCSLSG